MSTWNLAPAQRTALDSSIVLSRILTSRNPDPKKEDHSSSHERSCPVKTDLLPKPYVSSKPSPSYLDMSEFALKTNTVPGQPLPFLPILPKPEKPPVPSIQRAASKSQILSSCQNNVHILETDDENNAEFGDTDPAVSPSRVLEQTLEAEAPHTMTTFCEKFIKANMKPGDHRYSKFLSTIRLCSSAKTKGRKRRKKAT